MDVKVPIYMDHNATTPLDKRVLEAMMPYLTGEFGNAASRSHVFGWNAEAAVEAAREQVAKLIGASAKDLVFTSGATESDNLALKGAAQMYRSKGNHIITCLTEHKAVLDTCKRLIEEGFEVTFLTPDRSGQVSAEQVEAAITDKTTLVSLMAANNETGTLHPLAAIGQVTRRHNVLFHSDATQAAGKVPLDVEAMSLDLVSLSGHKMYGPKGVGALYVRRVGPRVRLVAQMDGGGHERGMRSGTLNVAGIVGMGAAAAIAMAQMSSEAARLTALRDRLHERICSQLDQVSLNGHPTQRLPNTLNLSFAYVEGEAMMLKIKDVAVSSGSACTSASLEPSHVLRAMGVGDELAHSSIRFSLGRFTTADEVDFAADQVVRAAKQLREMSPLYELAQEADKAGKAGT